MTIRHSAITPKLGKSMSQRRLTSRASSNISSLSLLQTPRGALPSSSSGLIFLLLEHLRRENIYKRKKTQKATMQVATTAKSTFSFPPPSDKNMSQEQPNIESSSSMLKSPSATSPLHIPPSVDAPLVSSRLDFLQEMHLRRERVYKNQITSC